MNAVFYVAAAMLAGLLLTRVVKLVHLPNVTGYLIAGLIIGPSCLNLLKNETLAGLDILTTVALGFIAFSIGVEFKLSNIRAIGMKCITITIFQALGAVILVDLVLCLCGFDIPLSITLGAIATATAPAATLMVVRQYRAKGPVTNTLLPVVAMDDAIGLVVFSVSLAVARAMSGGEALRFTTMVLEPLLEIVLSLVIGGALGLIVALSMRLFHSRANRLCVCIMAVFLGLGISNRFGLSDLLVCMSIGAVYVNLFNDSLSVLEATDAWTPPLFLLFFVISGAELDLSILPTVGLLGVLYILARSLGKYFGAFLGASAVKAEPNIKRYLGITLLPQAGVAIGMAQIVITQLPAYGPQIRAVVLCATLIYELVGPVLTKLALQKAGEITVEKKDKKAKAA